MFKMSDNICRQKCLLIIILSIPQKASNNSHFWQNSPFACPVLHLSSLPTIHETCKPSLAFGAARPVPTLSHVCLGLLPHAALHSAKCKLPLGALILTQKYIYNRVLLPALLILPKDVDNFIPQIKHIQIMDNSKAALSLKGDKQLQGKFPLKS